MNAIAWLDSLRAGDTVWVVSGAAQAFQDATVEGTSTTQVLVDGVRYSRVTGRELDPENGSWRWLRQPNEELRRELAEESYREQLLARVRAISWHQQSTRTLEQVVAVLDAKEREDHRAGLRRVGRG